MPRSPGWIVSAWWDLTYIVVTPLLIVPVVLILARHYFTAEQVSLAVIAFASLGHHLPGFMRAYGDGELFRRFRIRFLLAPVVVFGLALLFSPPTTLASALRLPWTHLHGLELILLVWGTWHGLMQTFGFMRIYDIRLGQNDRWTARLDHWLCLLVFVAGVVFSDARVFAFANAMWQSGLPLFGPEWIKWVRIAVGATGIAVLLAYFANLARLRRQGQPVSWLKLLLISTTGWFYWYTGRLSTNVLIGLAMFEIYHAVQYDAIVWIYNRRLLKRAGERFGPLGFLFRDRWTMLGFYLAAIAAYSSIRYFTVDSDAYVFRGGGSDAYQWLVALFVTSSFLHFYFDGFIWKVSEKQTQENLVDQVTSSNVFQHFVPGLKHAAKWAVLLAIAAGLLASEHLKADNYELRKFQRLQALAVLTPELPECQMLLARESLAQGNIRMAIPLAEQALKLRPQSHSLMADLGLAYFLSGKLELAEKYLQEAIARAPDQWSYHSDLGQVYAKQQRDELAVEAFQTALELNPEVEDPYQHLAEFYLQRGRTDEAMQTFKAVSERFPDSLIGELGKVMLLGQAGKFTEAVELANFLAIGNPSNWRVQLALGSVLNSSGEGELAIAPLKQARTLNPRSAQIHYQLGLAEFLRGATANAIGPLRRATRFAPEYFDAYFQLANTYYVLGKHEQALDAFARCQELNPTHPEMCANFGGLLATLGRNETAEHVYRAGLTADPDSARLHFNLGVLLWQQQRKEEGLVHLLRAEELGQELPVDVKAAIGGE